MFAEETYTGKSDSIEKIKEKFWTKNRHPHVYDRKLNEVYDTEKEVNIFLDAQYDSGRGRYVGNGLCDYQEITEAIEAY